jgi:hypothetical protein
MGIVSAVFLGQLKRQMLLDQARDTGGMQRGLLLQWPAVSVHVDDAIALALGFEGKDALVAAVSSAHEKALRHLPHGVVAMQPDRTTEALPGASLEASSSSWRGLTIGCLLGAVIGASAMFALVYEGVVPMPTVQAVVTAPMAKGAVQPPAASSPAVAAAIASNVAVASGPAAAQMPSASAADAASSSQTNAAPVNGLPAVLSAPATPLPASSSTPAR